MTINMGTIDRIVRLVVGAGLLAWALGYLPALGEVPAWGWIAGIVGAVFALTALVGNCPAYSILGVSTCGKRSA
jgi:uncharacterized membrane protein YdcZ (DUF606 family)